MVTKNELRRLAKEKRKTLDMKIISEKILQVFLNSEYFTNYKNIAIYYPCKNELDLRKLLTFNNKNFYLPKTNQNSEISFHKYDKNCKLEPDIYGILSPLTPPIQENKIDLYVIPALLVDKNGYRIGYGKGCYDCYFNKNAINAIKVVFIPEELLIDKIPYENHDTRVDVIITQSQIIKI